MPTKIIKDVLKRWVRERQKCQQNMEKIKRMKYPQKGKNMIAVRFAFYLNSESHHESLSEQIREWSGFVRSFKVMQCRRKTAW